MTAGAPIGPLLIVEDDEAFAGVLARALRRRGFVEVGIAANAADALARVEALRPRYAVVDLKLGNDNGLTLIPALIARMPALRVLLLTGYASIATAVEAMKRGAHDYLAKPVDADTVVRALLDDDTDAGDAAPVAEVPDTPLRLPRLEWEQIQRTLRECGGNISETARRLGMHRRTLQRKLAKHPARERWPD